MPAFFFALLAITLLYLASPEPGLAWLAWLAFVPLIHFCRTVTTKKAFLLGLALFTCYHLLTIYWIVISMEQYGGLPKYLTWPALLLLASYMSIYPALFCWLVARLSKSSQLLWFAPLSWVSLEYLRGILFSGFPWMDLAYSQYQYKPLIQCVDLGGHHLLSFVIMQANVLLYLLLWRSTTENRRDQLLQHGLALLLITMVMGYGFIRLPQIEAKEKTSTTLSTTIVQANINQSVKWLPEEKLNSIDRHIALTEEAQQKQKATLVVWPETALPIFPTLDPLLSDVMTRTVLSNEYNLLTGAPFIINKSGNYDLYNSALLLTKRKSYTTYFKRHLVPFGEYIPLRSILPLPGPIVNSMSDFSKGRSAAPLLMADIKIGVLICVEAIYPDLARQSTNQGATLLANITNDAWFGRSSAPLQHLAMTIFRAVENRRSLARAANTGFSAFVMPSGKLNQQTALFSADHISSKLPIFTQLTFFTRLGYFFPLFCAIATFLIILKQTKIVDKNNTKK